jgi:Zn-dependent protease
MTDSKASSSSPARSRSGGFGFPIGSLLGVQVRLDPSLVLIFLLILTTLGLGTLPAWHPDWSAATTWIVAGVAAIAFVASILAHELSHAVVGRALGVPVRGITLFLFGGVASMDRDSDSPRAELLMTIVGPLTSLVIGVLGILGASALAPGSPAGGDPQEFAQSLGPVATVLMWLGPVNVLLAIFNMVPGFPLDGGRVLRAGLWWATGDRLKATRWAAGAGQLVGFFLIACGIFMAFGGTIPILGRGLLSGLWLVLIGWFLSNAARQGYAQLLQSQILERTSTRNLVRNEPLVVSNDSSLRELMEGPATDADQDSFVVRDGDQWIGLVPLQRVLRVPRDQWDDKKVSDLMVPLRELPSLSLDTTADLALRNMTERGVDQLPVVERKTDRIQGFVRQKDILRWLLVQQGAPAASGT